MQYLRGTHDGPLHVPPLMLTRMRMLLLKAPSLALGEGTICWEALAITNGDGHDADCDGEGCEGITGG